MSEGKSSVFIALQTFIISCEHGGNEIPSAYTAVFEGHKNLLASHRGWDIGALEVAKAVSQAFATELHYAVTSRLLIELNRSLHHRNLFSDITKKLSKIEQNKIIETHYLPYRNAVSAAIEHELSKNNEVIHISVHSFTPELNGNVRNADIGLLYDPQRENEKRFCRDWKQKITAHEPYRVRFNYPYKGTADGFTTYLRKKFSKNYAGIELEINQALLIEQNEISRMIACLINSLKALRTETFN